MISGRESPPAGGPAFRAGEAQYLQLRPLDWDTDFFGVPMGAIALLPDGSRPQDASPATRASILERELRDVLADALVAGYVHLIFRVPAEDLAATWAAGGAGLRLVDIGVDSSLRLGATAPWEVRPESAIRAAQPEDLPRVQDLAGGAFAHSRFAADPFFSPAQVVAFFREWAANLCRNTAEFVLVSEIAGRLAGFVACTVSHGEGRIQLIATDPALRRQGVGRALVAAVLSRFATAGADVARVKTQAHNYPALALYHRMGFTVSETALTFSTAPGTSLEHASAARLRPA